MRSVSLPKLGFLLAGLCLLFLAGCSATESIDGDTAVYKYGFEGIAGIAAIGVIAMIAGAVWAKEDWRGWIAAVVGLAILVVFVPGMAMSHCTVSPQKMVMVDNMLWFIPNSNEVQFAQVTHLSVDEQVRWTRRGRRTDQYLVFNGTGQRIKANAMLEAALPRIQAAIEAARNGGRPQGQNFAGAPQTSPNPMMANNAAQQVPGNMPDAAPQAAPSRPAEPQGEPIGPTATLTPGARLLAESLGQWHSATVVEVQADGQVKVHYDGYTDAFDEVLPRDRLRLPRGAQTAAAPQRGQTAAAGAPKTKSSSGPKAVEADTELTVGTKLEGLWAGKWYKATVVELTSSGDVKIHWDDYSNDFDEVVPRSRLRMP